MSIQLQGYAVCEVEYRRVPMLDVTLDSPCCGLKSFAQALTSSAGGWPLAHIDVLTCLHKLFALVTAARTCCGDEQLAVSLKKVLFGLAIPVYYAQNAYLVRWQILYQMYAAFYEIAFPFPPRRYLSLWQTNCLGQVDMDKVVLVGHSAGQVGCGAAIFTYF